MIRLEYFKNSKYILSSVPILFKNDTVKSTRREKIIVKANKRGFTLVASIIMLVFASVAILGITTLVIQRLEHTNVKTDFTESLYTAQAGVNLSIYNYRARNLSGTGYFALGQGNVNSDDYFVIGADEGGLLMVDTSSASLGSGNRYLRNLSIQNATDSQDIRIDRMIITWNNNNRLTEIRISNSRVWRSGGGGGRGRGGGGSGGSRSPVNANIRNFRLIRRTPPRTYPVEFRFDGDMTGATISAEFLMRDGSSRNLTVFPASNQFNFTVKSTGKNSAGDWYRTIEAGYNAITGRVIYYNEIDEEIEP